MGFERIWSPWRKAYVTAGAKEPGCVLCRALEHAADPGSLVVNVAALNFVVMNLYPYNAGHVMIAPRRHVGSLAEATAEVNGLLREGRETYSPAPVAAPAASKV